MATCPKYYKNQQLDIVMTDKAGDEDLTTLTLRVDYWKPSTAVGSAADGTIADGSITKTATTASFSFAENVLDEANEDLPWRWQLVNTGNGGRWETDFFYVLEQGAY